MRGQQQLVAQPGTMPTTDRLRLGQAESMIALGQAESAIATLVGLSRTEVRPEALVMLGLTQLLRGQVDVALAVLREAVHETTALTHPEVYADAGLALLSTGAYGAGLSLLEEAHDVYRENGDTQAMRQLLTNRMHFAQAVSDSSLESRSRRMLLDIDAGVHRPSPSLTPAR